MTGTGGWASKWNGTWPGNWEGDPQGGEAPPPEPGKVIKAFFAMKNPRPAFTLKAPKPSISIL